MPAHHIAFYFGSRPTRAGALAEISQHGKQKEGHERDID
jgi:hypothetical protein